LVDTKSLKGETINIKAQQIGDYRPLYIGKYQDKILIDHNLSIEENIESNFMRGRKATINWTEMDFDIFVDTKKRINQPDFLIWDYESTEPLEKIAKSYPVLIKNMENQSGRICTGNQLTIILEAKDQDQNWRPIEEPFYYFCGTGLTHFTINPNEILITAVPIYKGSFQTELRLRFGDNYSNTFKGSINPGQFETLELKF
ncbi:MAG: hypothetical protein AAF705_15740, partial [Bacteroidota bacterium]